MQDRLNHRGRRVAHEVPATEIVGRGPGRDAAQKRAEGRAVGEEMTALPVPLTADGTEAVSAVLPCSVAGA